MSTQEQSTTDDELRVLRARAYGPDADIQDDPEALRRLHELEAQTRPQARVAPPTAAGATGGIAPSGATDAIAANAMTDRRSANGAAANGAGGASGDEGPFRAGREPEPRGAAGPDGEPAASAGQGRATGAVDTPEPPPDAGAAAATARTPWWRSPRTLWIASVCVAAIVASAVTLAVAPLMTGRVAVLQVDEEAERPEDFFPSTGEGLVFEEFYGLTALVAPQEWHRGEMLDCVFVRPTAGDAQANTGGCAGEGFPPTAALVISPSSPRELREQFPDGTALQFVVEGTELHVFAREPVVPPAP